ncbi:ribosome biogenesis protein ytm1 [Polyrhizophydium stewartii]|uniref:Ribosome biogenesis protein YTM1 n=1 Tax=Polyrhizophydium stewartii TaxID=2732419 RepID=A0ABR4N1K8_9FUNG|nr:WD repeat-containing protein 12 [Polyrhizophydium stewartii]
MISQTTAAGAAAAAPAGASAAGAADNRKIQTVFFSRQAKYAVTDTPILVPTRLKRYGLSEIINHLLGLETPVPFDFIIDGKFIKSSLQQFIDAHSLSLESVVRVEFVEASLPPKKSAVLQQDDWISSIRIHPSLPLILTGSFDSRARVWSKTGKCVLTLSHHTAPIKAVGWLQLDNTEGSYLLSGSQDQTVSAFHISSDGSDGTLAYQATGHTGSVEAIAVSEDSTFFATGSWDQTIRVWSADPEDVEEVEEERAGKKRQKLSGKKRIKTPESVLEGHADAVTCVAFGSGASSSTVYSGSMDHSVRVWDVSAQSNVSTMNCENAVNCLSFSRVSGLIVTGHADNAVRLWDPRSRDGLVVKMKFTSHANWVSTVAWSPSSGFNIASGSFDSTVKVWDVRSTTAVYTLQGAEPEHRIFGLDWSGDLLCSGGEDTKLHVFHK